MDFDTLESIELDKYGVLVATTSKDEANVLLASTAKTLGCKKTIARIINPEYYKQKDFLEKELSIDICINPDFETSKSIEKYLTKKFLLMTDDFAGGKIKMVEFNIGKHSAFVGKKIMELKDVDNLLVSAIVRNGITIVPNGKTMLFEDDIIVIVGKAELIEEFDRSHSAIKEERNIRKVLILGELLLLFFLPKD